VSTPRVSVITPTWLRHGLLFTRCIPSVQAQDCPDVEHVVVSDGPDPELLAALAAPWLDGWRNLSYAWLPDHEGYRHYGHLARLHGIECARADYITYCDDDDALRPAHCRLLADALDAAPDAGFAVSRMVSHNGESEGIIGWGPLACCNVGTPMIMHRRSVLAHGSWGPSSAFEDWELVERWITAGVPHVNVDAETSDVWPSAFW
jgi:glycosyltransferase involved in cell wall biosynthesis